MDKNLIEDPPFTNMQASILLRLSPSGLSRLLSGTRQPLWSTMRSIESGLGWDIGDQARSIKAGTFNAELRTRLEEHFAAIPTPADQ